MHCTDKSSLCPQSFCPQPLNSHAAMSVSFPMQTTLSINIVPFPSPKCAEFHITGFLNKFSNINKVWYALYYYLVVCVCRFQSKGTQALTPEWNISIYI